MCAIHELGMVRLLSYPLLTYFLTNIQSARKGTFIYKNKIIRFAFNSIYRFRHTHPKNCISCLNALSLIVPHMDSWIYGGEQIYHSNQRF